MDNDNKWTNTDNNDHQLARPEAPAPVGKVNPFLMRGYTLDLEEADEATPDLHYYLAVFLKRKWVILTFFITIVTIVTIGSFKATPIYKATAKIQIEAEKFSITPYKEAIQSSEYLMEYLQTQYRILQSRTLAKRVIDALDLERKLTERQTKPSLFEKLKETALAPLHKAPQNNQAANGAADTANSSDFIDGFIRALEINPIKGSHIVQISFYSKDPKLAADIANTLVKEYIEQNFESRFKTIEHAGDFLTKQLVDLRGKVEQSEEALARYAQSKDILGLDQKQSTVLQTLNNLNTELTRAQGDRMKKESLYNLVKESRNGSFPDLLKTLPMKDLERKLLDLRQEQARLRANFKPGWPELDMVANQIAEIDKQFKSEQEKANKNVEADYFAAVSHENLVRGALDKQKAEADRLALNSIQYNIIKREVDTNKQLHDTLLQRIKEMGVQAGLKPSTIELVDPAEVPRFPAIPRKTFNIALSMLIGLLGGVGLAFFLDYLDNSIKTPEDVDRYIHLPALGVIPSLRSMQRNRLLGYGAYQASDKKSLSTVELVTFNHAASPISESYRALRTSILLSNSGRPPKSILITSAQAGEGKTTTSINLATSLAQMGSRVLLIDCDMRKGNCHKAFGLKNEAGISFYLANDVGITSMIRETKVPNLYVIPAGKTPPNPAELIASPRLLQGLAQLDRLFNFIIIDSSPVLSVTDAVIISTIVDGTILVVKGGHTPKALVKRAKRHLQEVNGKILGVLVNNVDLHTVPGYYSYAYSYYYRNGQGE